MGLNWLPDRLRTTPANSFMNWGSALLPLEARFSLLRKKLGDPLSDVFFRDTFKPPAAPDEEDAIGDEVAEDVLFSVAEGEVLDGKIGGLDAAEDPGLTTTLPGLELPPLDLGEMLTTRSEDSRLEFRLGWESESGLESLTALGRPGQCSRGSEIRLGDAWPKDWDDSPGFESRWLW